MFVLRTIRFLLILHLHITCTYSEDEATSVRINQVNNNKTTTLKVIDVTSKKNATLPDTITTTKVPENNHVEKKKNSTDLGSPILTEGGLVSLQQNPAANKTNVSFVSSSTAPTVTKLPVHYGREGIDEINSSLQTDNVESSSTSTTMQMIASTTEKVIPIYEKATTLEDVPLNTVHGRVVPKKGVTFTEIQNSSKPIPTTTPKPLSTTGGTRRKPKKPTVTIDSDDEPSSNILAKEKANNSLPKVPTLEFYEQNKERSNKSNFVIPIVLIILSVPLVAFTMNVFYKRGKEWWSHRHYSRMDFLIDGMYNN